MFIHSVAFITKQKMEGERQLNSCIGKSLAKGKIQSFILEGEMSDLINVTFLYFDTWIKIVSADEITSVIKENHSIDKITHYGDKDFYYPINLIELHFPKIKSYYGKTLLRWKELVLLKDTSMSYGINLYFDDDMNFIIHNQAYPIDKNQYLFTNTIPKDLIEK